MISITLVHWNVLPQPKKSTNLPTVKLEPLPPTVITLIRLSSNRELGESYVAFNPHPMSCGMS
jgi:hypothetical protein